MNKLISIFSEEFFKFFKVAMIFYRSQPTHIIPIDYIIKKIKIN
jgi:hypothetical protein